MRSWFDVNVARPIPFYRRLAIALVSVFVGLVLCRREIAADLVARGDDYIRAGQPEQAQARYGRAALLDGTGAERTVDRISLVAVLENSAPHMTYALRVSSAYLAVRPDSLLIRNDRVLCNLKLRRYADAYVDLVYLARAFPENRRVRDMKATVGERLKRDGRSS